MKSRRSRSPKGRYLEHATRVRVRFQEVDALRIVWHGHFLSYFEDARVAFGKEYGIAYDDIVDAGYLAPIVHISVDYLQPARFHDELEVIARHYQRDAAKIEFYFRIHRTADRELLATGTSVQSLLDLDQNLVLTLPPFFRTYYDKWQDRMSGSDA